MGDRRLVTVVVLAASALSALVACASEEEPDEARLEATFEEVVEALGASDVDGPDETTSKDVSYVTGSGVVAGSPDEAAATIVAGLEADGWDLDVPERSADGIIVVALAPDGAVAVQIAVFSTIGTTSAPPGSSFAQIQVADSDADLAWTPG